MTLYILDINISTKKSFIGSLIVALVCIILVFIYSLFSHGVSSLYMTYCFLFPLLGCALLYGGLYLLKIKNIDKVFFNLYNSGISSFTVGAFVKGIFEIAGSDSNFSILFNMIGFFFVGVSIIYLLYLLLYKDKIKIIFLDKLNKIL